MTEDEDIDGLAAEYVLGSLDAAERAAVDARRRTDRHLAAAIAAWERRLAPLSDLDIATEATPPHLFESIAARIAAADGSRRAGTAAVVPFRAVAGRRLRFAAIAGALAACLVLAVLWLTNVEHGTPPPTQVAHAGCGSRYKDFWEGFDRAKYARISAEQLAGLSRMALRAYDACEAGDEQDASSLFDRLKRMTF
jgi:anti-sigma-K factor RskA